MSAISHSLRWRLQLWHGAILLLAVLAFCLTAYRLEWDSQLRHIDKSLAQADRMLIQGLMAASRQPGSEPTQPSPERIAAILKGGKVTLPSEVAARFRGADSGYLYYVFFDEKGRSLLNSENIPANVVVPRSGREMEEPFRTVGPRREFLHAGPPGPASVVGRDITPELEGSRRFAWSLGVAGFGVWALGLLGGWWLAGRAIKPIDAISRTATRIAAGNLAERIDVQGTDSELDQLGRVLNETFDRLHETLEQQKRFTADASHELRTPVTILLSETQRILKRERTPEEYREAIQTCHDAAARMRRLIEALLLLAKQETSGAAAPREKCDLAGILQETLAQLAPLAREHAVTCDADLRAAPCDADPVSLAILAANLVSNAIQHNCSGGHVHVSCASAPHGGVTLSVRDDGPGIPPEDLPHIFERFYRADQARTGSTHGHAGLGLAIAKAIVDNHGGTIAVESPLGKGTCFLVMLPQSCGQKNSRSTHTRSLG